VTTPRETQPRGPRIDRPTDDTQSESRAIGPESEYYPTEISGSVRV